MDLFTPETWSGVVFEVLSIIVLGLTGIAINWIKNKVKNSALLDAIMAKEELTAIVVNAVEQVYSHLDGPDKFDIAISRLAKLMKDNGLKVTEDELHDLIEDAVKLIKDEWSDLTVEDL